MESLKSPVIKSSCSPEDLGYTLAREVFDKLYERGLYPKWGSLRNFKVRVSFKVGKKRVLRNVRFAYLGYITNCEYCGPTLEHEIYTNWGMNG